MYQGIGDAVLFLLDVSNLSWIAFGTVLGLVAGTLPGVSGVAMMALILPFTFGMAPEISVLMLIGVYAASTYSSSTGGILYNIPGGAAGIPTTVEGYKIAMRGEGGKVLSTDIYASFIGSVIGFIGALILTPIFIQIASNLGTAERGLFALLALVLVGTGALSRADPARGLLAVGIGLVVGTVGMQSTTGYVRFVGDFPQLWDGFHLVWIIVGLYAIPQIFRLASIEKYFNKTRNMNLDYSVWHEFKQFLIYFREKKYLFLRVGVLGTVVGALPGLGTVAASWLGYQEAYRSSNKKEEFGNGSLDGVAGSETANNAAVPTTLVPLLALGIPGSAAAALILGAFLLAGVHPGPQMMDVNPTQIWIILLGLFVTGAFFVLFGLPFHKVVIYVTKVRPTYLIPAIVAFSAIGTYLATGFVEGIYIALAIGLASMLVERLYLPIANVLLGAILGPTIEHELLTAYNIGGIGRFFSPGAGFLLAIIVLIIITGFYKNFFPSLVELFKGTSIDDLMRSNRPTPLHDILLGSSALVAGGIVAWIASGYPAAPAAVPYAVAVYLVLPMGTLILLKGIFGAARVGLYRAPSEEELAASQHVQFNSVTIVVISAVCVAMLSVEVVGFIPAIVGLIFIVGITLRSRIMNLVIYAAFLSGALYFFLSFFRIQMPAGLFLP